jgi:N-acetylmuramic acid 6-phosphate etherase
LRVFLFLLYFLFNQGLSLMSTPINLTKLVSEQRNSDTLNIDQASTLELVQLMNAEDKKVPLAVETALPSIAEAVDAIALAFSKGARLIYIGAGTSGRLGILDASECPPTFGVPGSMVVGLIAGGKEAIHRAIEGAEDSLSAAQADLKAIQLSADDVVVGIAASGRTPYVIGGLEYANGLGCTTAAVSCNPASPIANVAKIAISTVVGPEVLTGSTRLKSGTAQKLVLNMLTTGAMIKFGKIYQNLMVDVEATNLKLVERQKVIVMQATECTREEAEAALLSCNGHCKTAILMVLAGCSAAEAHASLKEHKGFIRQALNAL